MLKQKRFFREAFATRFLVIYNYRGSENILLEENLHDLSLQKLVNSEVPGTCE